MANVLPREKKLAVLAALVDGNSIRAAERMTGVHRDTIMRLGLAFGEGCDRLHNRLVRDLSCSLVDVDEQWSFCGKKGSRVTEHDAPGVGDAWTWAAIDRSSRLAIAYHVGRRDQVAADAFVADLRARLLVMPTLMTSDGLALYTSAILANFGPAAPYAQTIKNYTYGVKRTPDHRYAQPHMGPGSFITKKATLGTPDLALASTSRAEVNNLLARHKNGRMRRLCLAFSKTLRGHRAAASLFYVHYNFCHVLRTTRVSPALASSPKRRATSPPRNRSPSRAPKAPLASFLRVVGGSVFSRVAMRLRRLRRPRRHPWRLSLRCPLRLPTSVDSLTSSPGVLRRVRRRRSARNSHCSGTSNPRGHHAARVSWSRPWHGATRVLRSCGFLQRSTVMGTSTFKRFRTVHESR